MASLRLGLRYDLRGSSAAAGSLERRYAALLEHAQAAEAAGIEVLWISERPFTPEAALPAAFPVCAAIAARTERVRIATGVIPLPLHHPLRVAEDAASLDGLSAGRFELGLGLGEGLEGFDAFGVPLEERVARLEEGVAIIRQAWSDAPVELGGRYYSISGVEVVPKPVQRPGPPIWIGAGALRAVRRAARLGDGLVALATEAAAPFLEEWRAQGRDPTRARIALELPALIASDGAPVEAAPAAGRSTAIWTPAQAVREIRSRLSELSGFATVDLMFPALPPGVPAAFARRSAELLAGEVRAQLGA